MKICYMLAFVLISFQNGFSQFKVNSFTPNNESTSVALTSDVVITFSDSLYHYESLDMLRENIIGIPMDSVSVNSLVISDDRKTLTFNVTHTANTDFSWAIVEVINTKGEFLDKTYSFNYTTNSTYSSLFISGNLYQRSLFGTPRKAKTLVNKQHSNWFKSFKSISKKTSTPTTAAELDYSHGLVLLTTVAPNIFEDSEGNGDGEGNGEGEGEGDGGDGPPEGIVAVTTLNENGEFVLPHVKNGTYFLTTFLFRPEFDEYNDETRLETYAIGFLDADEDYIPDTLEVENESITGLVVGIINFDAEFATVSINDIYGVVSNQIKTDFGANSKILILFGQEGSYNNNDNNKRPSAKLTEMPQPNGTSLIWMLGFYAPDSNKIYTGLTTPFGMQYEEIDAEDLPDYDFANAIGIDAISMNSDEAVQIAEGSGGATFRASAPENAEYSLEFTYSSDPILIDELPLVTTSNNVWAVEYSYYQNGNENQEGVYERHLVIIDASTKEVLYSGNTDVAIEDQFSNVTSFKLNQNYPNPFNPSTTIAFSLPTSANVSLTVYNSLGQMVSVLTNQNYSAGTHSVAFDASKLSSGVYFYQLQTPSFVETKKMMLVK